ncbi:ABC transporter ATP-binding protein [Campylobacter hyointestinalis]|uniref:ABC transporter ATP-binding protein n=1 Tax=Campylobacter hyointestinalis subsp. hyointestinalis TaxID=91352 RepID=A0A0S4SVM7_CAMHY|nr:ATP-binding cassette domain-containing protein [Campylobacter hyointestinalis]PPB51874.1 ABC transporter ATP-binding protein [Campylobacter hyointestinalis subsp. hyointestinalis]PPB55495.1 ABC transporter ATP-binding protein [Campylobacter hyointestinalis subsp. hyointestinalis]PPB57554.1 ABC transporter ATP-binding protein [Campylobacter hyointestinalis subsp. hyointestinalis]PPB66072.1 ABC transporter ATP-binding protein [Campylobacter hyointestinalis subsp. hyointestinalis]PPB68902.1 AB
MIKATDLSKVFHKPLTKALSELNFSATCGITGIVGPDGAGKTTLLRLCAGLLSPSSGELEVLGGKMSSQEFLDNIGYMPQMFGLYGDLSCEENLKLYAKLKGIKNPNDRINELLEFTNLKQFKDRLASSLSGGMKQKLAFGVTLLKKPKLLLLDEPGVGVDPISRAELWDMARSLNGVCILWATSYLDEASLCDKVILLNKGRILYDDSPKKIELILENRVFLARTKVDKRELLTKLLEYENVLDAYLIGQDIKFILKTKDKVFFDDFKDVKFKSIKPNFEDAFIDILKIKTKAHSELSKVLTPARKTDGFAVQAINLTKKFGSFVATNNVSFEIKSGEIFGFLGPNGAGKSTTFKMICGLLARSSGESLIYEKDINDMKGAIGYMAQKFSLYGNLGLKDNLEFFAGLYGLKGKQKSEKIASMIEIFGLKPYLENKVDELSLGLKQRLALSCSLMHSPLVLFLDEATSGVDPITRKEFWRHINAISKLGISVMITTHLMDEAELCDRIMIINKGTCIAVGTPSEIKSKFGDDISMQEAFIRLVKGSNEL